MAAQKSVIDEDALNIYTDGSMLPSPRAGGIGIRFVTVNEEGDEVVEDLELPGYAGATSNQMELRACIVALEDARKYGRAKGYQKTIIYTDSQYVRDNFPRARFEWQNHGWLNKHGKPVENADDWKLLLREIDRLDSRVEFKWVKGHSKNVHNKAVDKIAKRSAKNPLNSPLKPVGVRRKSTEQYSKRGSVEMLGQEMAVKIVTAEWMKPQQLHKYRYEVLSEESPYRGLMDFIYSECYMREGHHYLVTVNEDQKNPRVLEVVEELDRG